MTNINLQIDFHTIIVLRMVQVLFLPMIFVPISTLNYIGVPREKNNQVSGMSNFSRNLGGSIGTSLIGVFLARQGQINLNNFSAHTNMSNPGFVQMLNAFKAAYIAQGYDAITAAGKALAMMFQTSQSQAGVLGFVHAFWVMGIAIACLSPLPFIMRRPPRNAPKPVGAGAH